MGLADFFNAGNITQLFDAGKDATNERTQPIRVVVGVDPETPLEVVETIREALVPQTSQAVVVVQRLERGASPNADPGTDVALALCGGSMGLCHDWGCAWLGVDVPTLMIGRSPVEVPACTWGGRVAQRVIASDRDELLDRVGHWIIENTPKDVAFAANFPFCRRATATDIIHAVALSNAAVCAFNFLPGILDFTMVTANEFKMALDIAAVYDRKVSIDRLPEILSVFGFGFVVRTLASGVVKLVPKLSWLVNGAAGYAGALVTGYGLISYFEGTGILGEGLSGVVDKAKEAADSITEKVGTLTGDVIPVGPDATYSGPKTTLRERLQGLKSQLGVEDAKSVPEPGYLVLGPDGVQPAE